MVLYICQCYPLNSVQPSPSPAMSLSLFRVCVSSPTLQIASSIPLYICIYIHPLSQPSRSWQRAKLSSLCYIATSQQLCVLHMVAYICRCCFIHSSHSFLPSLCPQVSSPYQCLSIFLIIILKESCKVELAPLIKHSAWTMIQGNIQILLEWTL